MTRRGVLGLLGGVAAGMVMDPERLLWVPGRKLISIPEPRVLRWTITNQYVVGLDRFSRAELARLIKSCPFDLNGVSFGGRDEKLTVEHEPDQLKLTWYAKESGDKDTFLLNGPINLFG